MFAIDLMIINFIKSLALFTGTFKEGLMVLTLLSAYVIALAKGETNK